MNRRSFGPFSQIMVNEKSRRNLPTDIDRETQTVLPEGAATPGGAGRDIGKFEYNTPDADSDIKPRTLGIPGEQYGHPSNDTYNNVTRRTMTGLLSIQDYEDALFEEDSEEEDNGEYLKKRQKKQKGKKKRDTKKYYRKNRNKIKKNQKKYRKKNKHKIKRNLKKTKGKNRTRRNASVVNVVSLYLRGI